MLNNKLPHSFLKNEQEDSVPPIIQKSFLESKETKCTFNYLQVHINNMEIKDSEKLPIPISNLNIELQLNTIKNNKINMESDLIENEYISLQNALLIQNALKCNCLEQSQLKVRNESIKSITSVKENSTFTNDTKSLKKIMNEFNTEDITNNIPIKLRKSMFEKSIFTEIKDKYHNLEIKDNILNDENNDPKNTFLTQANQSNIKTNHFDALNKQIKTCSQCSMTFRYKRHLDRHLEGHQKNNCSHCNAKFARRKHLEIHLFRSHGERVTRYPHSCDVCPRNFPKRILLNRHRAKHKYENGKVCSDCGEMLKAEEDDKEHKENHCTKKQFECKKCLQTFSIEQTYLSHIQNHDNHKCSKCDVTFASKKKVHEHYKMVHSSKLNHDKIPRNGTYCCTDCKLTFLKKDDFSHHLDSALHLDKVNKEIPLKNIFTCSICSKKLISQRALDQHIRRIHKGEKRFMCNIYGCTFQCARKSDLDRHKQLHVEQRNIICEQCGKTFTSVSILNDHVLYIHNKERQFVCEECGKAFKRNSLLKRHKLSHQQYRPFSCMQCSTAFKRSHHLTRHMETCHRITLEKKKKVVKLMKTEDGHLIPVPEKPKKLTSKKIKVTERFNSTLVIDIKSSSFQSADNASKPSNSDLEVHAPSNSNILFENTTSSLELSHLLANTDCIPQVLSLVDINTEEVATVKVTSPRTFTTNDLIDQFETNSNEILSLTNYQDLEFQSGILCTDQSLYDHTNYSELSLGTVEAASPFAYSNINKVDTLPVDNYFNQSFPSFLNL